MALIDLDSLAPGSDAWIFPGQGAQRIGMSLDFADLEPRSTALFAEADEILGYALSRLIREGPEEDLAQTIHTQPAVFVASLVALKATELSRADLLTRPLFVAGHSLGEYVAVVASGALSFADGLRLVQERARLMQVASERNPGTLAALLGATLEQAEELCAATGAEVCNLNAPGQVVVGGSTRVMAAVAERARDFGIKRSMKLNVGGPFHTSLMAPAVEGVTTYLEDVSLGSPRVPLMANGTASPVEDASALRDELIYQLNHPVRWEEGVKAMIEGGVKRFLEFGPGGVLAGMIKRIDPTVPTMGISSAPDLAAAAPT